MRQVKIFRWLANAAVCILVLAAGCAPAGKEAAKPQTRPEKQISKAGSKEVAAISLEFSTGDSTTYRVITESEKSIKWDGGVPDEAAFKGGRNYEKIEMTFTQEIQSIDDKGDAIAKITVKGLKASSIAKDSGPFEFDSTKLKDPNHPMARLMGKSYTIKIAPTGEVAEVIDVKEAEAAVRGGSMIPRRALRLLTPEAIKNRHGTAALPDANKSQLHIGDTWSKTEHFNFGLMGEETYEKVYTLNKIEQRSNHRLAVIEMKAIPSSEKITPTADYIKSYDTTKTYTGQLKLDLTTGKVGKYSQKLQSEWVTVFPSTNKETGQEEPAILTMLETRFYSIEEID